MKPHMIQSSDNPSCAIQKMVADTTYSNSALHVIMQYTCTKWINAMHVYDNGELRMASSVNASTLKYAGLIITRFGG